MTTIEIDYASAYAAARSPVLGRNVVATSQPLAAQAGLRMLLKGGNAVDAAIAAAMALTVVEPTGCGIGSDAFAIVWDGTALHGLNASGRAPAAWTPQRFAGQAAMPVRGWESVSVPGAVSSWVELSRRFGKLPFAALAEPAIAYARYGFALTPIIATQWARAGIELGRQPGFAECFLPGGSAPKAGELFMSEAQAASLELIAETQGEAFYQGVLAEKMTAHAASHGAALTMADLADHRVEWEDTISLSFAGALVHELPPNGQGITALICLGILKALGIGESPVDSVATLHLSIEAMKLAMADLYRFVADPAAMDVTPAMLLDPGYLAERAKRVHRTKAGDPGHGAPKPGGTVYLTAADESGMMVSFIQSNYMGFGSGVVVPGTGISLQNRGCAFSLDPAHPNIVGARKRPFHTIIPGFATTPDGAPLMSFGVMGAPMQAQGHVQMLTRILLYGQNPQTAADAPRWRVLGGRKLAVEPALGADTIAALQALGHDVVVEPLNTTYAFGGAQLILKTAAGYVAGSDPRKDGHAAAY